MEFGAFMFFTDHAMAATEFAQTLEAREFEVGLDARLAAAATTGSRGWSVMLPSEKSDTILPTLDRWAELIGRVG